MSYNEVICKIIVMCMAIGFTIYSRQWLIPVGCITGSILEIFLRLMFAFWFSSSSEQLPSTYEEWLDGYDPFSRPPGEFNGEPSSPELEVIESACGRMRRYQQSQLEEVSNPDEWQWYHHHNESSSSEEDQSGAQQDGNQPSMDTLRRRIMRTYRRGFAWAEAHSDQEEIWRVEALMNEADMW